MTGSTAPTRLKARMTHRNNVWRRGWVLLSEFLLRISWLVVTWNDGVDVDGYDALVFYAICLRRRHRCHHLLGASRN